MFARSEGSPHADPSRGSETLHNSSAGSLTENHISPVHGLKLDGPVLIDERYRDVSSTIGQNGSGAI
jgi:hypothetical protein